MNFLEKLNFFESKNSSFSDSKIIERAEMMKDFQAISLFEGLKPSKDDSKLYDLYAKGKLSKQQYIDLCLEQIGYHCET